MPVYDDNILPKYSSWTRYNTVIAGNKLYGAQGSYAYWQFNTKNFNAGNYALISCGPTLGTWFFYISYKDNESNKWYTETIKLPNSGFELPIVLQQAKVDALIFRVECKTLKFGPSEGDDETDYVSPISFQLIEQAIRSVDLEYASGTSKVIPPETGWQTNAPAWQTGRYIWQRTATTFIDGHTEYSDPILIQNINSAGILEIEEQYYLSTSNDAPVNGYWSMAQPSWSSKRYIWTRSKITWSDNTVTYSEAVLARALNEANERAEEAVEEVKKLDKDLSPDGVFKRLTDNGKRQGLYIEDGNYYFNATYIRSGVLEVLNRYDDLLFRADMSSNSIYLAGFTASNYALYYGPTYLKQCKHGTYIGTDGITSSDGTYHMTLYAGRLSGGFGSGAEDGYIDTANYWDRNGNDKWDSGEPHCLRVGGNGGILFSTSRIGVLGYYATGGDWTVSVGRDLDCSVLNSDGAGLIHNLNVTYTNVLSSVNYITWKSNGVTYNCGYSFNRENVVKSVTWQAYSRYSVHFKQGICC